MRIISSRENHGLDRGNGFNFGVNVLEVDSADEDEEDEEILVGTCRDRMIESAIVVTTMKLSFRNCEPDLGLLKSLEVSNIQYLTWLSSPTLLFYN